MDLLVVLSASVFDSCNSLHGALHFLSIRLASPGLRACCRARSYSLGHRRVVQLSWHDFFFLSVLRSGSLTPPCQPGGYILGLSGLHTLSPAKPKSLTSLFRSSSLRSRSFHLVSFQSTSILFTQAFTVPRPLLPPCAAGGRTPVQRYMSRAIVTHDVPVSKFISSSSHKHEKLFPRDCCRQASEILLWWVVNCPMTQPNSSVEARHRHDDDAHELDTDFSKPRLKPICMSRSSAPLYRTQLSSSSISLATISASVLLTLVTHDQVVHANFGSPRLVLCL